MSNDTNDKGGVVDDGKGLPSSLLYEALMERLRSKSSPYVMMPPPPPMPSSSSSPDPTATLLGLVKGLEQIKASTPEGWPKVYQSPGVPSGQALVSGRMYVTPVGVDFEYGEPVGTTKRTTWEAGAVAELVEAVKAWRDVALVEEQARQRMFQALAKLEKTEGHYSQQVKRYWSQHQL